MPFNIKHFHFDSMSTYVSVILDWHWHWEPVNIFYFQVDKKNS